MQPDDPSAKEDDRSLCEGQNRATGVFDLARPGSKSGIIIERRGRPAVTQRKLGSVGCQSDAGRIVQNDCSVSAYCPATLCSSAFASANRQRSSLRPVLPR